MAKPDAESAVQSAVEVRLSSEAVHENGKSSSLLNFYKMSGEFWPQKTQAGDFVFGLGKAKILVRSIGERASKKLKKLQPGKCYILTVGILRGHAIAANEEPYQGYLFNVKEGELEIEAGA